MLTRYDKEIDTKYITLLSGKKRGVVTRTEKIHPWLLVDYDKHGNVFGIEVLNVSKHAVTLSVTDGREVKCFPRAEGIKPEERSTFFAGMIEEKNNTFPLAVVAG